MEDANLNNERVQTSEELVAELLRLRDALTTLSLSLHDIVFEADRITSGAPMPEAEALLKKISAP